MQLSSKLPQDPLPIFEKWLADAKADGVLPNPDAMALSTVNSEGQPSTRIVLCKQIVTDPGYLVFYTNYESAKGQDLLQSQHVSGAFHWDHLNRQVRFQGLAIRSPQEESDAYFATRDKESQISAWASAQSQPIPSRRALEQKHVLTTRKLADMATKSGQADIPRPPFWGGYRVWIASLELWVRGQARLHDRGRWERSLEPREDNGSFKPGNWASVRIQP